MDLVKLQSKGGAHRDVRKGIRGDRRSQSHHAPSQAAIAGSNLPFKDAPGWRGDAPAVCMSRSDHQRTASFGGSNRSPYGPTGIPYKTLQITHLNKGEFFAAQNLDIGNIRDIAGARYETGIIQMRNYTIQLVDKNPNLFKPQHQPINNFPPYRYET
ncbi:MAG: hypothetical protein F6K00_33975 [Leptolyngbya sp. SIOISBB]|nr:hypothetical protein [Leptolyngbya sp. SIOISBB]